jgi:acyl-CoA hydrolase
VKEYLASGVEASRASVVRLSIPSDANFMGNVFGGVLLNEVDRVAYVSARRHAQKDCVTASFDRVDFIAPVHVGELIEFTSQLTYVGTTSMEIWVQIHAQDLNDRTRRLVGNAYVTMVAMDRDGHPSPVPSLALASDEERQRFEEGKRRMEARRKTRVAAGESSSEALP